MVFRGFSRSMGGSLLVGVLAVACSRATPPSATLFDTAAPSAPATQVWPSITPPPETTTLATTTALPVTTVALAINGLVPKSDAEREVLVAADRLFALLDQTVLTPYVSEGQLQRILVDPELTARRSYLHRRWNKNEISRLGTIDALRFQVAQMVSNDRWIVTICEADNGSIVDTKGTPSGQDDEVVNNKLEGFVALFQLQLVKDGWRISTITVTKQFEGNQCDASTE